MKISVILPSLNPDEKLIQVVKGLIEEGFDDIIIVNDGSDDKHLEPFKEADRYSQVTILTHEVNKGKGRALKTAFSYCMEHRRDIDGVVTVDGDNQHRPSDIKACCEAMLGNDIPVVLGCRDFTGRDVPPKSKIGNNITRFVFRFACGIKITDTQTGLRVFKASLLPLLTQIKGERFEYETQMLLELNKRNIKFREVTIDTVYIEDNATTHFHPIRDSIKIYMVILKFIFSSIMSFLIDIALFTLLEFVMKDRVEPWVNVLVATAGARVISSVFNYAVNRNAVFESDVPVSKSMPKYYILCIVQAGISYGLVYLFSDILSTNEVLTSCIKVVVDICLFLLSFQIQRRWVFAPKRNEEE